MSRTILPRNSSSVSGRRVFSQLLWSNSGARGREDCASMGPHYNTRAETNREPAWEKRKVPSDIRRARKQGHTEASIQQAGFRFRGRADFTFPIRDVKPSLFDSFCDLGRSRDHPQSPWVERSSENRVRLPDHVSGCPVSILRQFQLRRSAAGFSSGFPQPPAFAGLNLLA